MFAGMRGRELPMPNTCKQFNFLHSSQTQLLLKHLPFVIVRCLNGSEHFSDVLWGCIEPTGDLVVVQGHRMPRTYFASSGAKICYRECRLDEERACNGERNAQGCTQQTRNSKKVRSKKAAKTILVTGNGDNTFSIGAYSCCRTFSEKKCTSGSEAAGRTHRGRKARGDGEDAGICAFNADD